MDSITHGMLAFLLLGGFFDWRLGGYVAFLGAFPDFDIFLFPLSDRYPNLRHRSVIHSILFMAILPPIMAIITTFSIFIFFAFPSMIWILSCFLLLYVLGTIAYGLHLLIDSLTYYGAPVFWPMRKQRVRYDIFGTVSAQQLLFSLINVIFLSISRIISSNFLFLISFTISVILYTLLFSYYITSKIKKSRRRKTYRNKDYYHSLT